MQSRKFKTKTSNSCKSKSKTKAKNSRIQLKTDILTPKETYSKIISMRSQSDHKYSSLRLEKDLKTRKKINLHHCLELKAFKCQKLSQFRKKKIYSLQ